MSESEDGQRTRGRPTRDGPPPDEVRCRVTRKKDGERCENPEVADDLGICVRHLRDREVLVGASGDLELGSEIPDAD